MKIINLKSKYFKNSLSLAEDLIYFLIPIALIVVTLILGRSFVVPSVLVTLYGILFIPGFLAVRLIFPDKENIFWILLISLSAGLFLALYPSLLIYFFRLRLELLPIAIGIISSLLLVVNVLKIDKKIIIIKKISPTQLIIGFLVSFYVAVAIIRGSHEAADAVFHIGYTRFLVDHIPVNPFEAFFPVNAVNPSSGYSLWYLVMAAVSKLTRLDAYIVWRSSVYLLAGFIPLGIYYFTKAITKSKIASIWAVVFSTIYYLSVGQLTDAVTVTYPDRIARLLMVPVIVVLMQKLIENHREKLASQKQKILILGIGALVATAFSVHMFSWLFSFVLLLIFYLIDLFYYKLKNKETIIFYLKIIGVSILFSTPALFLKLTTIQKYSSYVSSLDLSQGKKLIGVGHGMIIVNPKFLTDPLLWVSVLILIAFWLFHYKKEKPYWFWYSWLVIIVPVFIMLFPPTATLGSRLFSPVYIRRLTLFMPLFIVLGAALEAVLAESSAKTLGIFVLTFMLIGMKPTVNFKIKDVTKIDPVYGYVKNNIPANVVVASNLWDSLYLATYSNHYIIAVPKEQMSSNVDAADRTKAVKLLMNSSVSQSVTKQILDKYKVGYLLIRKIPPIRTSYRRYWISRFTLFNLKSVKKFQTNDNYEKVYEDSETAIFKVLNK